MANAWSLVCHMLLLVAIGIAVSDAIVCVDTQYERPCDGWCSFSCGDVRRTCSQPGCIPGCRCPRRTPVLHEGRCIAKEECPSDQACSGGRVWNVNGKDCTPSCENQDPYCSSKAVPRCECPASKPIWDIDGLQQCGESKDCRQLECGSAKYDPGSHMCCGSTINVIPTNRECCGETAYDRYTHICCAGALHELLSTNDGCCGLENFVYTTHGCCRGSGGTLEVYNMQSKICCDGVLNDRPTVQTKYCCGTSAYATETHMCCEGNVEDRDAYICCRGRRLAKPDHGRCCGEVAYSKSSHLCCEGTVMTRASTVCCGGVPYDRQEKRCCHGNVYPKTSWDRCCGANLYHTRTFKCCKGEIVSKDVACP